MTEQEPTNEQIAEALPGFEQTSSIPRGGGFSSPAFGWRYPDGSVSMYPPDFKNDNNASWKYVWPRLRAELVRKQGSMVDVFAVERQMSRLAKTALDSDNPALYLATEFIRLKGG